MSILKVKDNSTNYWAALPIPREWRVIENLRGEGHEEDRELEKFVMNEWLSAHPMEGD